MPLKSEKKVVSWGNKKNEGSQKHCILPFRYSQTRRTRIFGIETSTERRREGDESPRPMGQKGRKDKELRNNEAYVRQPGSAPGRSLAIFQDCVFPFF